MAYLLVVDDQPDSVDAACALLTRSGHEVVHVDSASAALTMILARPPDLIVLDLLMPGMDGVALMGLLRSYARLKGLPMIVYTGVPDGPAAHRARGLRAAEVLEKGKHTPKDVLDAVNRELARPAA